MRRYVVETSQAQTLKLSSFYFQLHIFGNFHVACNTCIHRSTCCHQAKPSRTLFFWKFSIKLKQIFHNLFNLRYILSLCVLFCFFFYIAVSFFWQLVCFFAASRAGRVAVDISFHFTSYCWYLYITGLWFLEIWSFDRQTSQRFFAVILSSLCAFFSCLFVFLCIPVHFR